MTTQESILADNGLKQSGVILRNMKALFDWRLSKANQNEKAKRFFVEMKDGSVYMFKSEGQQQEFRLKNIVNVKRHGIVG